MDRFLRIQEGSTYWSISDVPKMASLEFIASGNASEDDGNMVWGEMQIMKTLSIWSLAILRGVSMRDCAPR